MAARLVEKSSRWRQQFGNKSVMIIILTIAIKVIVHVIIKIINKTMRFRVQFTGNPLDECGARGLRALTIFGDALETKENATGKPLAKESR